MLNNTVTGDEHLDRPFTIGNVNHGEGYVHVLDDTTLSIVMSTLDTITDLVGYLAKKERLLTGNKIVLANGEEELLAHYLGKLNRAGEHDFVVKGNMDVLHLGDGLWTNFVGSPERQAQIEYNRISYSWDRLIEKFAFHVMTGTEYIKSGHPLKDQEVMFRLLAAESRTRRRLLSVSLHQVLERSRNSGSAWDARVMLPSNPGDPYYLFLLAKRPEGVTDAEYRRMRIQLLSDYCNVAKLKSRDAKHIIGLATEAGDENRRSGRLDLRRWV